jgi:hypothetical protein
MDPRVKRLRTAADCEQFAKNCEVRGEIELAKEARRHAIELRAMSHNADTPLEREALAAIYAYEDLLTLKNGRRTRASRTWPMLEKYGIKGAVERAVNRRDGTSGHALLVEMGYGDLAFEAVVLRHPREFSSETVEIARRRTAGEALNEEA